MQNYWSIHHRITVLQTCLLIIWDKVTILPPLNFNGLIRRLVDRILLDGTSKDVDTET